MSTIIYKIEFEYVDRFTIGRNDGKPDVEIPEEDWRKTDRVTTDPWDQYNVLIKWQQEGNHHVRNVKLFEGDWKPVVWRERK